MYQSPDYWELERQITRLQACKSAVDTARTFRSMAYGGSVTIESANGQMSGHAHSLTISEGALKNDLLKFMAERFDDQAQLMYAEFEKSPGFDLKAAAKV